MANTKIKIIVFAAGQYTTGKDKFASFFISSKYDYATRVNCFYNFTKFKAKINEIKKNSDKKIICVTSKKVISLDNFINFLRTVSDENCFVVRIFDNNKEKKESLNNSYYSKHINSFLNFRNYDDLCKNLCYIVETTEIDKFIDVPIDDPFLDYKLKMEETIDYFKMIELENNRVKKKYDDDIDPLTFKACWEIHKMEKFIELNIMKIKNVSTPILNGYLRNYLPDHECFSLSEEGTLLFLGSQLYPDKDEDIIFESFNFGDLSECLEEYFGRVDHEDIVSQGNFELEEVKTKDKNYISLKKSENSKIRLVSILRNIFSTIEKSTNEVENEYFYTVA